MKHIILACTLALTAVTTAHAETKMFPNSARLATVSGIQLTTTQRKSYQQFRAQRVYFGAFYVREGTDFTGDTINFHSFDTAKAAARKYCEAASGGKSCTLYAVTYPQGVDPNAKGLAGFSQPAAKDFKGRYKREQIKGKYGAFSLNGAHGYVISFGWKSAAEAREAALSYCKADSAQALAPLGIEGRKWALARGLEKCRVVDTHTPD
ncbi:MAG: hypothetical protein P8P40_03470 [Sulfitobacter sp.]|nr:hypothetical protein [Sulfitobacter sp.]